MHKFFSGQEPPFRHSFLPPRSPSNTTMSRKGFIRWETVHRQRKHQLTESLVAQRSRWSVHCCHTTCAVRYRKTCTKSSVLWQGSHPKVKTDSSYFLEIVSVHISSISLLLLAYFSKTSNLSPLVL